MIDHITPTELKARLDAGERPAILDVREGWELEIARLEAATHIPMNEIPERLQELDPARELIVMCRSGARSLRVAEYLAGQGFGRVANLSGGILAWGEDIDPTLRAY
jgi:adenylyltransferase/sulfurtransferase